MPKAKKTSDSQKRRRERRAAQRALDHERPEGIRRTVLNDIAITNRTAEQVAAARSVVVNYATTRRRETRTWDAQVQCTGSFGCRGCNRKVARLSDCGVCVAKLEQELVHWKELAGRLQARLLVHTTRPKPISAADLAEEPPALYELQQRWRAEQAEKATTTTTKTGITITEQVVSTDDDKNDDNDHDNEGSLADEEELALPTVE